LLEFVADRLQSNYKAVLLSRESQEFSVVAEGIWTEIVPLVLAARLPIRMDETAAAHIKQQI
jgi:hypothetical protein